MAYDQDNGPGYAPLQAPESLYTAQGSGSAKPAAGSAATKATTQAPASGGITLFIYDASFADFAPLLQDAYYPGAISKPIKNLVGLAGVLSKNTSIDTLVLFTHSIPGSLLLGAVSTISANVDAALAKTGAQVSGRIVFEGCSIMKDPLDTCKMIKSIAMPKAVAVGFNYFSITQPITFDFRKISKAAAVAAEFKKFSNDYWLKKLPDPATVLGKKIVLGRRWFRDELDHTVAEQVQRGIASYTALSPVTVGTKAEAQKLKKKYDDSPVVAAEIVTVTDIAAVAK